MNSPIVLPHQLSDAATSMAATPHFRNVKRVLLEAFLNQGHNLVMVTSLNRSGGSTTVALSLMRSIQMGDDTNGLFIDCNAFSPTLKGTPGVLDYLQGKQSVDISDLLHDESLSVDDAAYSPKSFKWIKIGEVVRNTNELFAGRKMRSFLTDVKERYSDRLVIMDCGNALRTAEARTLLEYADQIIVVVNEASISPDECRAFCDSLPEKASTHFVMNKSTDKKLISQYETLPNEHTESELTGSYSLR